MAKNNELEATLKKLLKALSAKPVAASTPKKDTVFTVADYTNAKKETFKAVYRNGKYLMRASEVPAMNKAI